MAFLLGAVLGLRPAIAVSIGIAVAVVAFVLVVVYQRVRFARADAHPVDDAELPPPLFGHR